MHAPRAVCIPPFHPTRSLYATHTSPSFRNSAIPGSLPSSCSVCLPFQLLPRPAALSAPDSPLPPYFSFHSHVKSSVHHPPPYNCPHSHARGSVFPLISLFPIIVEVLCVSSFPHPLLVQGSFCSLRHTSLFPIPPMLAAHSLLLPLLFSFSFCLRDKSFR